MKYNIRIASLDDIAELSILKKDIWESTYRGIYSNEVIDNFNYEEEANKFKNIINSKDKDIYVVENDKEIMGCISFGVNIHSFEDYTHEVNMLYIRKNYQGQGLGRILFDIAYNSIKEKGIDKFFIGCNKYNDNARKFYEKMGGKIVFIDKDRKNKYFVQVKYCYNIN